MSTTLNEPIARYLDAAVLRPEFTREETCSAIDACVALGVRTVCVRPCDIELAVERCGGSAVDVCSVLAFPHGDQLSASKADEARRHVALGVREIDMVANYGWARSGLWAAVEADIAGVVAVAKPAGVAVKVIFETACLDEPTVRRLVEVCVAAGADFVKTSTGFNGEGATDAGVRWMLEAAAGRVKVKPSGGIRDRARAEHLLKMGAHRLGVNWSSCAAICSGGGSASAGGSY